MKNKVKMKTLLHSKSLTLSVLALWAVLFLFYSNILRILPNSQFNISTHWKEKPRVKNILTFTYDFNETGEFLINTAGCKIPNYQRTMIFKPPYKKRLSCEERGIFIKPVSDDKIIFIIDEKVIQRKRKRTPFKCCYKFVSRPNSEVPGVNDTQVEYSKCTQFSNGTTVKQISEFITVKCLSTKSLVIYQDAYFIIKKISREPVRWPGGKWNVLLLGMDTMSRARARYSLPTTIKYFKDSGWLDYKGYQKVGENTYPNLMAMLSGDNKLYCERSMDTCNDRLIWSKFREAGYVTAYAEDNLDLPDTFKNYGGFEVPPTDHYMRTFFLIGENSDGNQVCSKRMSTATHVLNFASQLSTKYENDRLFGFFWLNSYSHNTNYNPTLFDKEITYFLNITNKENTFIFFISDHGIRFGETRYSVESYYEERLPMFYMWVPTKFREQYRNEFYNLQVNQNRFVTTYDVHKTLWEILKMSDKSVEVIKSELCPQCNSLFDEISIYRTCKDAAVDEKWCTCHILVPFNEKTRGDQNIIVTTALQRVQNHTNTVKTTKCTKCAQLKLKQVLRVHSYYNGASNKTHYVVAFLASPGETGYEVIVDSDESGYKVTLPMSTITSYNMHGGCVLLKSQRGFCICVKINGCKK